MASKRRKRKPAPKPGRAAAPKRAPAAAPKAVGTASVVRYRVELKPAAERDLAALERRDLVRVARKIDALARDPHPPGAEKLNGARDLWRVRVQDYRILYTIRSEVLLVLVVRVGHRREVYR